MNGYAFDSSHKDTSCIEVCTTNRIGKNAYRFFCLVVSFALTLILLPHFAWGDENAAPSNSDQSSSCSLKDEVIYIKTSAEGSTEGVYAINIFPALEGAEEAAAITDPGSYESVVNLSSDEELVQGEEGITLTPLANESFYYEGIMSAETTLPWKVSISYTLDGSPISANDLAGKSGTVELSLSITPNEGSDFTDTLLIMAQGTFDADHFSIKESSEGATIAHAGSNEVATALALPGESVSVTITGDAHDFSYDGWQISAMKLSSAIELADKDTSALSDATQELEDALAQLDNGASSLSEGNSQLAEGTHSVESGATALAEGAESLSSSGNQLEQGWNELASGITTVQTGAESLATGIATYKAALQEALDSSAGATYQSAQAAYEQALTDVMAAYGSGGTGSPTPDQIEALNTAAQNLAAASGDLGANQALDQALSGLGAIESGATELSSGTKELSRGAQSFDAGLSAYVDGTDEVYQGAQALRDGATSLAAGADETKNGSHELSEGLSTLAAAVEGMDEDVLEELQTMIDELLGSGFELHSFVAPENTQVNSVQFIYVVEGIEEPENTDAEHDSTMEASEEDTLSILDRFFALF